MSVKNEKKGPAKAKKGLDLLPKFLTDHFSFSDENEKDSRALRAMTTGFLGSMAMNFALCAVITTILPLKKLVPVLVAYGDNLDKIIFMRPLEYNQDQLEFLIQAQLARVIKERYEIVRDVGFMKYRLLGDRNQSLFRAHVSDNVYRQQLRSINNQLKSLEQSLFRREIIITAVNSNPQRGFYTIHYDSIDSKYGRGPRNSISGRVIRSKWTVTVGIAELPQDEFSPLNPLGIQIFSYSITPQGQ